MYVAALGQSARQGARTVVAVAASQIALLLPALLPIAADACDAPAAITVLARAAFTTEVAKRWLGFHRLREAGTQSDYGGAREAHRAMVTALGSAANHFSPTKGPSVDLSGGHF
jgi:hypothetical protein